MKNVTLKIFSLLLIAILLNSNLIFSQSVKISDNTGVPNTHAILDVDISTNDKGLLIPRLTTTQRNNLASSIGISEDGLMVYDETTHSFFFWNGTTWKEQTTQGANWSIIGNSTINSSSNFIGTVDANDLVIKTNNSERARITSNGKIGINTTNPDVYLHIFGDDATTVSDDATYTAGTGLLVIGDMSARNLVIDQNEILARNGNTQSSLYLQNRGGDIRIHYDRPTTTHDDGSQVIIKDDGKVGIGFLAPQDMLHIYAPEPYLRFEDKDGGSQWNMGVNGNNTRFQIAEDDGTTYYSHRFVIKQGGNVGIGTVSPEGLLHIKADAGNNATLLIDANAGTNANDTWKLRSDATSHNLDFYNDINTRISIMATGNVGIGTTSPEGKLHLSASEGNNATLVIDADEGDDLTDTWKIRSIATNNNLDFINNVSTLMSIESGGNIGIGTDAPTSKLDVRGENTDDGGVFSLSNSDKSHELRLYSGKQTDQNPFIFWKDGDDLRFSTDASGWSEKMRLTTNGDLGIGVNNPSERLQIDGAILLGNTGNSNTGAIQWTGTNFEGYDGSNWVSLTGSGGNWALAGSDIYRNTGNVGINTTTPNEKLEVNGSIRMTDGNEGTNKIMVSDANGTASWSNENDGVKTRVIRQINGGASTRVTLWSHPEGIDVEFDPSTERVYVTNNTGDATHYWDITIEGDARAASGSTGGDQYIKHFRKDGEVLYLDLGTVDSGWFRIIAADQNNQKDGFILNIVYYGDDLNGTVQYWDN